MLAIIPARGGSKGIPRKNVKHLAGKPMIYYTIVAAQKSNLISRVVVSTDDVEIAEVAESLGAEIPFMRPDELASDHAKAIDNYLYTVELLNESSNKKIEDFIVLQPTSPLRQVSDINNAIEIFRSNCADSVISVVESEHPPNWFKKVTDAGNLVDFLEGDNTLNRQEYDKTYLPNGAIYIFKYSVLKKYYKYYTEKTFPYIMSKENSIDIDNSIDFFLAEALISSRLNKI